MSLKPLAGLSIVMSSVLAGAARADEPNTLSDGEKQAGWRLLFDGRTTAGWRGYRSATMPASWKVENGSLLSRPRSGESRGDVITVEQYDDFELVLEWKMTKGGNSGVVYRATEAETNVWETGPEFQILDNAGHLDGLNPLASAGACYAVFAPARDLTRPLGQWNQARIVAQGKHVEHWLNGEKLLEYDVGSDRWQAHVKTSKFFLTAYGKGNWGLAPKGHIGLQDYGGAIEYRGIKLRPLGPADPPPRTVQAAEGTREDPGTEGDGLYTIGPDYKIDPDLTDLGNPQGKSFEFSMPLASSKIFRGDDSTIEPDRKPVRKERRIFVYVPAAYQDGTKAPVLVIHDGPGQLELVRNALDNLTVSRDPSRKLPAFIAIAVENGGSDGKNSERGLEYDTLSDRLARFIHDEVLPSVLGNAEIKAAYPRIAFTENPWERGVMGCSSGGAAALTMAWFRPDLFRRVIAYSGTFVDQQDDDAPQEREYPLGAWEYHSGMRLIETSEKKPLRIFTHVSENDLRSNDPEETHHNWVMAGQRTAAALKAKGYHQRFVFSRDTRHCDRRVFEQTLADTLVWVWRGYRPD